MPVATRNPSLLHDLGMLAGLYRNVFWMMGHKEKYPLPWPGEEPGGRSIREERLEDARAAETAAKQ